MKKENRVRLSCTKKLHNGITESFELVTDYSQKDVVKKNYESRGYRVTVLS